MAHGLDCILETQYRRRGQFTAWCAQYDEDTLLPTKVQAFKLVSLSGDESVAIVRFLLGVEDTSPVVKTAIDSAVPYF